MTKLLLLAALALTVSGCEKATPTGHRSGALTAAEGDLFAHLPAGANIIFGGSMFDMQKRLAESAIGRLSAQMTPPELTAWNACLAGTNMTMAGTVTVSATELAIRFFLKGPSMATVEGCARKAGLPVTADPDGKFVVIEITTQGVTSKSPYLAVANGVYGVTSMSGLAAMALGGKPIMKELTRADLEREVASLGQGSAATDPKLVALLAKVDRRKMIWFAGSAEGTPLADKVTLAYGSFSLDGGLAVDLTVKPTSAADTDRALAGFGQMKSQLGSMPASMAAVKDAIRAVKFAKVADGVRLQVTITDAQLDAIMKAVGPMMPGMQP